MRSSGSAQILTTTPSDSVVFQTRSSTTARPKRSPGIHSTRHIARSTTKAISKKIRPVVGIARFPLTPHVTAKEVRLFSMTRKGKWPAKTRTWAVRRERMEKYERKGQIKYTRTGTPTLLQYADEMPGVPLQNIWTDIPPVNPQARERVGYPTQKPESLLERIVTASSNAGDIVLDPFCGCRTTIAVAERLKRQWVGIDISPTAVNLMRRRLLEATNGAVDAKLIGMPTSEVDLKRLKHFEFQNWVLQQIVATPSARKTHDMGIDGLSFM